MSARLEELRQALARGERDAVGSFWRTIDANGAPLVELLSGDGEHALVTFLWRGDSQTRNVLVLGGWHGYHAAGNQLQRLGDTDVWYRSYRVRGGTRATYHMLPNDESTDAEWWARQRAARPDPRNSRTLSIPADDEDPADREVVLSVPPGRRLASGDQQKHKQATHPRRTPDGTGGGYGEFLYRRRE